MSTATKIVRLGSVWFCALSFVFLGVSWGMLSALCSGLSVGMTVTLMAFNREREQQARELQRQSAIVRVALAHVAEYLEERN